MRFYTSPLLGVTRVPVDEDLQFNPLPYSVLLGIGYALFLPEELDQPADDPTNIAGLNATGTIVMPPRFFLDYNEDPQTIPVSAYPFSGPTDQSDDLFGPDPLDRQPALTVTVTEPDATPLGTYYLPAVSFDEALEPGSRYPLITAGDWTPPLTGYDGVHLFADESGAIFSRRGTGPSYTYVEIGSGRWLRWF